MNAGSLQSAQMHLPGIIRPNRSFRKSAMVKLESWTLIATFHLVHQPATDERVGCGPLIVSARFALMIVGLTFIEAPA